ncbi:FG-GAP-like repeat-containing protein [Bradyrhizobium sp. CCGUVB4N]|uniref:FG-GAP-like repeat-containing protein n=1 Tax=Bradyrhizobium sp. CCGUVB4N TaxID=2949631 RepID=UPI0020B1939B|nr:FG-GAP-like repeat-containing protein [Bradyrhizobium sp. CCGUVB4N]MCP3384645.1 FG-GAP-like repeat-containing protein [Bradyrhizobium sp. CCGUVB4N]
MATSVNVSATNNADIDGLLAGTKWSGTISYSFPTSSSTYANPYSGGSGEPTTSGFSAAPTQMQAAINYAIALIQSYTNASITYNGSGSADIMVAQSPAANPTSYAYYPGNYAAGGDVWFGTQYDYTQAQLGNYYFTTALHELGHAMGLKHSQETGGVANVAVPSAHDDSEYTVMSYRSYVGGPLTGYTNEAYGYPQTYMANDILALQTLYGANYNTQSGNTVYTWSPTTGQEFINGVGQLAPGGGVGGSANRIYDTVWDGNGVDTYDLSNYTTNLTINLNPGASSVFSTTQLAYLGNGHYAAGNVYNAYLYNGDARSYIDNATGGSGNDTIIGNVIANVLKGGAGNDTITGGGGNDTIIGGAGIDTAVYSGSELNYLISYDENTQAYTIVDERPGSPDGTDTVSGVEYFQFSDGNFATSATASGAKHASATGFDFNGDQNTDLLLVNSGTQGVTEWLMNGVAVSVKPQVGTMASGSHYATHGDFNNDGNSDLLMVNDTSHDVVVWEMDGAQILASQTIGTINAADGWQYSGTGDFDGDGRTDLLLINSTTNGVAIWTMNGTQVTANPQVGTINAASGWRFGSTGDFNGDGKTDLLMLNNATHGVAIWEMNGTQVAANPQIGTINAASGWSFVGSGDFNGDGKTDLLLLNSTTKGVAIWEMNGTQVMANPQIGTINAGAGWAFAGTGDFNGDGKTDLLLLNSTTKGVAIWELDGTQVIANPQIGTMASGFSFDSTNDFNGDHKTDLLFENSTTHALVVWEMNGTQVAVNQQIGTVNDSAGWHIVT